MGGSVIPGRYIVSAIASIKNIDHVIMYGIAVTATSMVATLLPVATSCVPMLVLAILHGFGTG
jgi:hypothetical protein